MFTKRIVSAQSTGEIESVCSHLNIVFQQINAIRLNANFIAFYCINAILLQRTCRDAHTDICMCCSTNTGYLSAVNIATFNKANIYNLHLVVAVKMVRTITTPPPL